MKTATARHEIDRQGVKQEATFTIKASPKAFYALSDTLYSDKITAIIRELCCNAYDSHVSAGCVNKPFYVKLPYRMDPDFIVRDYGISLTHDEIMTLYTTYFESNKTHSNDLVGCLGLGSKTPFSYTKSFTVTAFLNGEKRIYTAFIGEDGCPSIAQLGETMETDEPNGLEVRFGVKNDDYWSFSHKAPLVLREFQVVPTIKAEKEIIVEPVGYTTEGTNWGLRTKDCSVDFGACLIMGNIRYPLDRKSGEWTAEQQALIDADIDIQCPIGSVEFTPSREKLSFDDNTIKTVQDLLDQVFEEICKIITDEFAECKNTWEVQCMASYVLNDKFQRIGNILKNNDVLTYNNEKISLSPINLGQVDPELTRDALDLTEFRKTETYRSRVAKIVHSKVNAVMPSKKSIILIKDIDRGSIIRSKSLIDSGAYARVYLVKFVDDAQKEKFITALGMEGIELDPISSIPSPTKTREKNSDGTNSGLYESSPKARVKTLTLVSKGTALACNADNWKISDVDMDDGGFYVPITHYKVINDFGTHHVSVLTHCLRKTEEDAKIIVDGDIIGVKPVILEKFKKHAKWVNVFDYIKEQAIAKANTIPEHVLNSSAMIKTISSEMNYVIQIFKNDAALLAKIDRTSLFSKFYNEYLEQVKSEELVGGIRTVLNLFDLNIEDYVIKDEPKAIESTVTSFTDVIKRYPLLDHLDLSYWDKVNQRKVAELSVDYINMIESMAVVHASDSKKNKAA